MPGQRWDGAAVRRVEVSIWLVRLLLLANTLFLSIFTIPIPGWPAFILSVSGFYLAVLDPLLRRPRLVVATESRHSVPNVTDPLAPAIPTTWVVRLKVANYGQTSARNCIGRLMEVRTYAGESVERIDPHTLYWAGQDAETGFSPVNIQGFGDFSFLEIVSIHMSDQPYSFCVVQAGQSPSALGGVTLPPEVYFLCIGIYADSGGVAPIWFVLRPSGQLERAMPPPTLVPAGSRQ